MQIMHVLCAYLKGQCHEIFNPFFIWSKKLPGLLVNKHKRFREIFRFHEDICKSAIGFDFAE